MVSVSNSVMLVVLFVLCDFGWEGGSGNRFFSVL